MEPEKQNNYWGNQPTEDKLDQPTEMYAPQTDDDEPADLPESAPDEPIEDNTPVYWSASEYVKYDKNALWFVGLGVVALAFIVVDFLAFKSYTFSALVIVMVIAIIVLSLRPARTINYTLSGDHGLYIGDKLYHFSEFKSFGLVKDHDQHSIMLIPIKRFSPGVSVYFPEEVGERIVDIFGARLPMENRKLDIIDIVVQKLRL
jgi:hypothetical protein